jgi:hypothetical protein
MKGEKPRTVSSFSATFPPDITAIFPAQLRPFTPLSLATDAHPFLCSLFHYFPSSLKIFEG